MSTGTVLNWAATNGKGIDASGRSMATNGEGAAFCGKGEVRKKQEWNEHRMELHCQESERSMKNECERE